MEDSKLSLKEYLDKITSICRSLTNEELLHIILSLAKNVHSDSRGEFLSKIEACVSRKGGVFDDDLDSVSDILEGISELEDDIRRRVESIENGSFFDDPDNWQEEFYGYDDYDYVDEYQVEELESYFDVAGMLFLDGRLRDARRVYAALFDIVNYLEKYDLSVLDNVDIKEARARYCRCVYETSDPEKRLDEFLNAMEVTVMPVFHKRFHSERCAEVYPFAQDVIEAGQVEMKDLHQFWPQWKEALDSYPKKGRVALLFLEATLHLEGIEGLARLVREWKDNKPQGYLFWLDVLARKKDLKGVLSVGKEALGVLESGREREKIARFMLDAAKELADDKHILLAKREKFFSVPGPGNLLDYMAEATHQGKRDIELNKAIEFSRDRLETRSDLDYLYVRLLLMAGDLRGASVFMSEEDCINWSFEKNAGVVYCAILSTVVDHCNKASTINALFREYANDTIWSFNYLGGSQKAPDFYDQIKNGIKRNKEAKKQAMGYFPSAEKIGRKRIEYIVSNKYRGSYSEAAKVLCSLAEAYVGIGQKEMAEKILREYYRIKYNRYSAFRREVRAAVRESDLLRHISFM